MKLFNRRTLLMAAAVLAVLALLVAWVVRRAREPAPPGAELFDLRCGGCHKAAEVSTGLAGPDAEARRRALEVFLSTHTVATRDENETIVTYLSLVVTRTGRK